MASTTSITLPDGRKYDQPTGLFINNKFVPATGDEFTVLDPVTEEEIIKLRGASTADVDDAVVAARRASEGNWSELAAIDRGTFLYKIAELIDRDRELIAAIDAYDNGKAYTAALSGDLDESYNIFRYYAGAADKISGRTIETSPAKLAYVLQEPLGVCSQIIPWNFPFMMLAWKVAPALACGNTVILKPAEQTPLSALYFGNLIIEAGLPEGAINIVPGIGTATGQAIMRDAASNLKNITLECGGKSPLIVFDDADLDLAVKWSHFGIMDNKGEVCTSTSRIYVQEGIYDTFLEKFVQATKENKKIGKPFDDDTYQGPQVSKAQFDKVLSYIEQGKKEGARLLCGGPRHGDKGYFIRATVFADTREDMKIVQEEIFGPVVVISKFSTVKEAIDKANDSSYGLAAALFTEKIAKAHIVARKLQAGMVWINSSGDSHFRIPFGGYKSSGIGRELGQYALDAYTQSKAIHINLDIEI
ncbi:Aldehyde/histidinol dehydrogenase [Ilyonectria destructans]|nr:Aldehyde/histidinol dehydrogenase [Ilyonectria destructans]